MNKSLLEVVNSRGMVVRSIEEGDSNKFGKTDVITIEGSTHKIMFVTNVLHGVNYCKIIQVEDLYKNRVYKAERFFFKFISLVSAINGDTHALIEKNKISEELK